MAKKVLAKARIMRYSARLVCQDRSEKSTYVTAITMIEMRDMAANARRSFWMDMG